MQRAWYAKNQREDSWLVMTLNLVKDCMPPSFWATQQVKK